MKFPEEKDDYNFASGSFDTFMNEISAPKQLQDITEDAGLDELEQSLSDQQEDDEPLEKIKMRTSVAKSTGNIIAIAVDSFIPMGLALAFKAEQEEFKATDEERETLADAFSEYAKLKGGELPPWLAVLITVLSIYGSKAAMGYQAKKVNDRNIELEKQLKELRDKYENDPDKE